MRFLIINVLKFIKKKLTCYIILFFKIYDKCPKAIVVKLNIILNDF